MSEPTVPAGSEAIARRIAQTAPEAAPHVLATLQPAVRLVTQPGTTAAPGSSRYGGDPDLPDGTAWPHWTTPEGETRPLRFFAQLDLASVAAAAPGPLDLPTAGLLSFFADFDAGEGIYGLYSWEQPGSTVLFTPPGTATTRTSSPASSLPEAALATVGRWTWRTELDDVDLDDDEFDALHELDEAYEQELRAALGSDPEQGGRHQAGGLDDFIQHPVAEEVVQALAGAYEGSGSFDHAAWERNEHQVPEWRLLLQIDSDDAVDAMWGDVGTIYWMARRADVAAGRWDEGMFNFQCS